MEGRADTLFDVLEVKFGKVPDDLHGHLLELKDPEIIRDMVRKAVNAKTIDEFARLLKN